MDGIRTAVFLFLFLQVANCHPAVTPLSPSDLLNSRPSIRAFRSSSFTFRIPVVTTRTSIIGSLKAATDRSSLGDNSMHAQRTESKPAISVNSQWTAFLSHRADPECSELPGSLLAAGSVVEHDFRLQEGQVVRTWKVGDPPEGGSPQPAAPQPSTPHQQDSPQAVRPPAATKKNRKKCFWFL
ncbi:hypothetical protein D9C73_018533 [Collichthys lucidus]|uniref:Uncharacterized protein n=1 Tax=Collichthys lucidus TaxID=240159 RepID=A0A4U5VA79_COLLU|nr:hypothetical protein D9C73_018533 [Collichthys lucidus]